MFFQDLINGSNVSQSPIADNERTVNWYFEPMESRGATTRAALYPTPGVEEISEATLGPGKAHFWDATTGREFAVEAATFWEISLAGTWTSRGAVASDDNPATISSNGAGGGELFITAGGNGYNFTLATNTLAQIAALNGKATMGDQSDGYFIVLDTATSTYYLSDLFDGATWDPTQFAQNSATGDPWISMKVANRYLYLFGSETSQVWWNKGSFPFPFELHPSGVFPYGCAAAFSPEVVTAYIQWLGATASGSGAVLRTSGFSPESVSTYAFETAIGQYSTIADAIGDTYERFGHTFYMLTFPTANTTWVFDTGVPKNMAWHERGTWNVMQMEFDAWRPLYHAFAFGENRFLDRSSSALYRLDDTVGTDADGGELRRLRRSPTLFAENRRVFYGACELFLEPGLGTVSGQGSDPQVTLRISNDGGKTWGNEMSRSAGAIGEYGKRVRFERGGSGRKRCYEFVVTDPIPWRLMGAIVEVQANPQQQRGAA